MFVDLFESTMKSASSDENTCPQIYWIFESYELQSWIFFMDLGTKKHISNNKTVEIYLLFFHLTTGVGGKVGGATARVI